MLLSTSAVNPPKLLIFYNFSILLSKKQTNYGEQVKQAPFSFYDFLGYLIPGSLFLYLLYFDGIYLGWGFLLNIGKALPDVKSSLGVLEYFPVVIIMYVSGHFISIMSSFVVENYCNLKLDFPSVYLFTKERKGYFYNYSDGGSQLEISEKIKRTLILLIMLPIFIIDLVVNNIFNQARQLPDELILVVYPKVKNILEEKFKVREGILMQENGIGHDLFRVIYHYVYEKSEKHGMQLQKYVALYGFSRNVAFSFLFIFWVSLINSIGNFNSVRLSIISALLILSYSFFLGFVKFYRRYTLEALMAVCVIDTE